MTRTGEKTPMLQPPRVGHRSPGAAAGRRAAILGWRAPLSRGSAVSSTTCPRTPPAPTRQPASYNPLALALAPALALALALA